VRGRSLREARIVGKGGGTGRASLKQSLRSLYSPAG